MKSGIRSRFLTILAVIVAASLVSGTISVFWTKNLGNQFQWVNAWSLPFGKELIQTSSDLELVKRELERSAGQQFWGDARFKPKRVPQWALDLVANDLERMKKLSKHADESWQEWVKRITELFENTKSASATLFEELQTGNFENAGQTYPKMLSQMDLLQRELTWARRKSDRETRLGFESATDRLRSLESAQIVLFALMLLISLLVLWLGERTIMPLVQMREWIKRVAEGAPPAQVPIQDKQLGELSVDLRSMARSLDEKDKALDFQRARLEEQNRLLQQVMHRLDQSERLAAIGRMSAQVAHDVGNPLHSIGLEAEIALEELNEAEYSPATTQAKQSVKHILESVARLRGIVDRYLSMSKAKTRNSQVFDLGNVLETVVATYANSLQGEKIRMDWQRSGGSEFLVSGDEAIMEQVLGNLISNSIQALKELEPNRDRWIQIQLQKTNAGVICFIEDSGNGVSDSVLGALFQPFVTSKANGTGLGLSFCKQTVESMGGNIQYFRGARNGACFQIQLPSAEKLIQKGDENASVVSG